MHHLVGPDVADLGELEMLPQLEVPRSATRGCRCVRSIMNFIHSFAGKMPYNSEIKIDTRVRFGLKASFLR
jgi:hypothetical protein